MKNSEYETNMLNFNILGIKIGTTLSDFKKTTEFIYDYSKGLSEEEFNLKAYLSDDIPNIDICVFRFFDDKLSSITILYKAETCNKWGGFAAVLENLMKRYGQTFDSYDNKNEDVLFEGEMIFDNIDRCLHAKVDPDSMILDIIDLESKRKVLEKKKASMDLGF